MCRLSWILGASTSWNPQGLSRPVIGLLYQFITWFNVSFLYKKLQVYNLSILYADWVVPASTTRNVSFWYKKLQVKKSVKIIFWWGCHWIDRSIQRLILVPKNSRTESVSTHIIFKWCHRTHHPIQRLTLVHRISAKKSVYIILKLVCHGKWHSTNTH